MGKKIDDLKTSIDTIEQVVWQHRREINQLRAEVSHLWEWNKKHSQGIAELKRVEPEPIVMSDEYSDTPPEIKRAACNLVKDKEINAILNKPKPAEPAEREATNDMKGRMLSLMATRLGCEIHLSEVREFFEAIYDFDADDVLDAMLYAQAMIMGEG